ncbi:MAG: class I SAM-dependent methyltransferase [Bacteroidales bacterium]|jgi:2-polyprenyl-3-methyl-5-hydroxy-6-metoxy-1,4-benzoquinol methylase|nr:class I SAM-dependent methyltransferase [Bacteroidales bacterium]
MEEINTNPWFISRKECPACSSGSFRTVYHSRYDESPVKDYLLGFYLPQGMIEFEYLKDASYHLCECLKCGLIFQRDIPDDVLMERLYEHWIDPGKAMSRHSKESIGYHLFLEQEVIKIIAYIRKDPSDLCFLDFGMGWGDWAIKAKRTGCDSYGTELSEERIKYARSNGVKILSWEQIPDHSFDFINTEQVLEHLPQPLQTLRYLKSALKPDGIIKISVPAAGNIRRRLKNMDWNAGRGTRNSLNPVAPLEHLNFFTRSALLNMAAEAGMKEVVIPLGMQYKHLSFRGGPRWIMRGLLDPLRRNILKSRNYFLFRNV